MPTYLKINMHQAWLSKSEQGNRVQCLACSHYCKIHEGKTGVCGVRKNNQGKLELLVYGKIVAKYIDPVEKKPLFHFFPGEKIFSIGTVGCNFKCPFCQNWDISQVSKPPYNQIFGEKISIEEIVDYCLKNNIVAIAYTYNEPTIFFEFAYDLAKLAHSQGLKNVFISNGYLTEEGLNKIDPYLDAINIDLKAFSNKFYASLGARLDPVLEGIRRVYQHKKWLEITTLLISDSNDSDEEITKIAQFIADIDKTIPWHISRFHPDYQMNDRGATSLETLEKAYKIGKEVGLKYVYLGNVVTDKENTYCPKCGEIVIKREIYSVEKHYDEAGTCRKCGTKIPLIIN